MEIRTNLVHILALIWGIVLAFLLQFTEQGRYIALRRTWIAVVIGVGVDLLLVGLVPPTWRNTVLIFVLSSIGIIARSIILEYTEERKLREVMSGKRSEVSDQDQMDA